MALGKPGTVSAHNNVEAQVYCLKKEEGGRSKPVVSSFHMLIYSRTFDCTAQMHFTEKELMMPGEDLHMNLKVNYQLLI